MLEEAHGGMCFFDDTMRVLGDVNRSCEGVLGIRRGSKGVGNGFDARRWLFMRWQGRRGFVFWAYLLAMSRRRRTVNS